MDYLVQELIKILRRNELSRGDPVSNDVIVVTPKAIEKIKQYVVDYARQQPNPDVMYRLRLGIQGGGCAGFTYDLQIDDKVRSDDTVIKKEGIELVIDRISLVYLEGSTIDYTESLMNNGLVIKAPKATGGCGCGSSVSF